MQFSSQMLRTLMQDVEGSDLWCCQCGGSMLYLCVYMTLHFYVNLYVWIHTMYEEWVCVCVCVCVFVFVCVFLGFCLHDVFERVLPVVYLCVHSPDWCCVRWEPAHPVVSSWLPPASRWSMEALRPPSLPPWCPRTKHPPARRTELPKHTQEPNIHLPGEPSYENKPKNQTSSCQENRVTKTSSRAKHLSLNSRMKLPLLLNVSVTK